MRQGDSKFEIIDGRRKKDDSLSRGEFSFNHLRVVKEPPARIPKQLSLPLRLSSNALLVVVGFDEINFENFSKIIDKYKIKIIVDIRSSPLFRERGFNLHSVELLFKSKLLSYIHFPEAGYGRYSNDEMTFHEYRRYLRKNAFIITRIYEYLKNGPLMILGWTKDSDYSEIGILIDYLWSCDIVFDLIME